LVISNHNSFRMLFGKNGFRIFYLKKSGSPLLPQKCTLMITGGLYPSSLYRRCKKACVDTGRRHYLFPGSFLKEPPYLLLLPRISVISGMKLANIAWSGRHTSHTRHGLGRSDTPARHSSAADRHEHETFRTHSSMPEKTIRILDEEGWRHKAGRQRLRHGSRPAVEQK